MGKIEEAKKNLGDLSLPDAQQNEISALTFLALANLRENDPWKNAECIRLGIHDIIQFINATYDKTYAENTRESIRRQVIHQFEQARIVDRNSDDPTLATNSPRTHYALTKEIFNLVRLFDTDLYSVTLEKFLELQPTLAEIYRKDRDFLMVPVKLNSGKELKLSPGKHNELQAAIISEFAPRFAPGSVVVYP